MPSGAALGRGAALPAESDMIGMIVLPTGRSALAACCGRGARWAFSLRPSRRSAMQPHVKFCRRRVPLHRTTGDTLAWRMLARRVVVVAAALAALLLIGGCEGAKGKKSKSKKAKEPVVLPAAKLAKYVRCDG